ncbi:testis-expressed protein 36-like [Spea bombifrons]|nr:testis-expressed protein 36-like [Spea bombifrons]XP_053307130.1 testis-expressed protein 36-like [Spea bombifrons]XP_053307131.1 testis-expressed protein 36-like [Spea bombifrons]XP_053307133.1 testis-expressed protein 36-like [Spea bombifrons]
MLNQTKTGIGNDFKLPQIYKTQRKNGVHSGFPFSLHDNKYSLHSVEYFDAGLGRRKSGKSQHSSQNFNLFCHETLPNAPSTLDGASLYQDTYKGRQDTERPFCRRFPKNHKERSAHMKPVPENRFMWFGDYRSLPI